MVVHALEAVTLFGSASTLAVLGLAVAVVLWALRRWSLLLGWAAALAGTGLQTQSYKELFGPSAPNCPSRGLPSLAGVFRAAT